MKPQGVLGLAVMVAGLALLAGCSEEAVDDLDRLDAAPVASVSAEAIESPVDGRVFISDAADRI